ncbi:MAG: hypothetical protein FWE18_03185 [Alphaproteobacteria bacterium]|nr:hypothetical protein [Alphaproteobacteria bacterium]
MGHEKVFKCGLKPTQDSEINDKLFEDCISNNYAVYGWNQSYSFNNMKRGNLLVVNKGNNLLYIGQVVLPPSIFGEFIDLSSIPILDTLYKEKFIPDNDYLDTQEKKKKWVMIHVKKFYDISIFKQEHKSQSSGEEIIQPLLVEELNNIFNYITDLK